MLAVRQKLTDVGGDETNPSTSTNPPAAKLVTFININHPNYDCSQFANSKPINKIKMTVVCGEMDGGYSQQSLIRVMSQAVMAVMLGNYVNVLGSL